MKKEKEKFITVQSFKQALTHFLQLCDDNFHPEDTVRIFSDLKKEGFFEVVNDKEYWRGNHDSGQQTNRLYLVDAPFRFYVVEKVYEENSCDFQGTTTQRWV